eukprot:TRINITY_DN1490_c0_g1_i1.p1 TRINITY_DN1490_c0_g1~~TRINITY_DN1490_c0_g1_i1.p1  ORF type:complete len:253 (+),score=49.33 TRINITY_DN1490_c0_g1_i1:162-920(+)
MQNVDDKRIPSTIVDNSEGFKQKIKSIVKPFLIVLIVVVIYVLLSDYINKFLLDLILGLRQSNNLALPLLFFAFQLCGIPSLPLLLAIGAVYTFMDAIILVTILQFFAIFFDFIIARHFLPNCLKVYLSKYSIFSAIEDLLARNDSFRTILLLRFGPFLPQNAMSFMFGLIESTDLMRYLIASAIGLSLLNVWQVYVGSTSAAVVLDGQLPKSSVLILFISFFVTVLTLCYTYLKIKRMLREKMRVKPQEEI